MKASQHIRDTMARVAALRQQASQCPALAQAVLEVKRFQSQRFAGTYPDLLASPAYGASARFFLTELYGVRDFSLRDQQFVHVASALELTLPQRALATTLALTDLHGLTEELDLAMARHWMAQPDTDSPAARYLACWRAVGRQSERDWQLKTVLRIGQALGELTRKRSLRLMLTLMRKPAQLAGIDALQNFLESGFDHFAGMTDKGGSIRDFLALIGQREAHWIAQLFNATPDTGEQLLGQTLQTTDTPLAPDAPD
jgi:hypothetical protein